MTGVLKAVGATTAGTVLLRTCRQGTFWMTGGSGAGRRAITPGGMLHQIGITQMQIQTRIWTGAMQQQTAGVAAAVLRRGIGAKSRAGM